MDSVKILIDGMQKDVYGLFYIYDSKYYFIYTEKELDENGYVILYMSQVGKETKNTENGPVDTGYMVGVEITNPEEQQKVQTSISYIVEDKKNNTINPQIQYLPMSMLINLKIVSKKRFRLLKTIVTDNFKINFDDNSSESIVSLDNKDLVVQPIVNDSVAAISVVEPVIPTSANESSQLQPLSQINNSEALNLQTNTITDNVSNNVNVIVDYRTKYFEEEEKNKELQARIDILTQKLEEIKKVIE